MSKYETLEQAHKNCYNAPMAEVDPILQRYHTELESVFGDRLARVVLFGSRARGDARSDSDYDVAVFLHKMGSFCEESLTLAEIESTISRETGIIINSLPFSADKPAAPTILMHNIAREGISL